MQRLQVGWPPEQRCVCFICRPFDQNIMYEYYAYNYGGATSSWGGGGVEFPLARGNSLQSVEEIHAISGPCTVELCLCVCRESEWKR
jgi:hypothetical protein